MRDKVPNRVSEPGLQVQPDPVPRFRAVIGGLAPGRITPLQERRAAAD